MDVKYFLFFMLPGYILRMKLGYNNLKSVI